MIGRLFDADGLAEITESLLSFVLVFSLLIKLLVEPASMKS